MISMHSPSAVVGNDEQRIFFGSRMQKAFLVRLAVLNPVRDRRSFFIIREVFGQVLGIELYFTGRC